jgi:polysaccharide transporter, PST family
MNQRWTEVLPAPLRNRIAGRYGLQKIISNATWLFADKGIGIVTGLLVSALVGRYLGPEQFGLLGYALAFGTLLAPFAFLGLNSIVVRELVRQPAAKYDILGTAFTLQLIGALSTFALTLLVINLLRPGDAVSRWLVAIVAAGMVLQVFDTIDYWFQSRVQSKYTVWAKRTAAVVVAVVKIALILMEAPLVAFAWAAFLEIALGSIGLVLLYRLNREKITAWRVQADWARRLLKDSWPLIFSTLAIGIYMKFDKVMLTALIDLEAVGYYEAAVRISEPWYFIPVAVASSVFPAIVQTRERHNPAVYRRRMQAFYDVMAGVSYAIALPLALFASPLVTFLFGADFAPAAAIFQVHIWAFLFVSLAVARSQWLIAENLITFSMWAAILGAVANVALNFWLIPLYAGLGAAWATLLAYALSAYLSSLLSRRVRPAFRQLTLSLLVPLRLPALYRSLKEVRHG